jgi:3-oxoacyl-[acyl-carrier protein] reductase
LTSQIKQHSFVSITTEEKLTMTLVGKRAFVMGAGRGIGASIAKALAGAGADVAITYETSADRPAEVVRAIEAHKQSSCLDEAADCQR